MNRIPLLLAAVLAASAGIVAAQNQSPIVTNPVADFTQYAGAPARSIDLLAMFRDPDASAAVRMQTVLGNIDVALFGQQKPITVANFLNYVNSGRYFKVDPTTHQLASSFIHRSVPGFVIQGGGFIGTVDPTAPTNARPTAVTTFPPIQNEPGISNRRGTIAMAKTTVPNSATSQWFINLANNTSLDDPNDPANTGGFTVFGRVAGGGMIVVDNIAALPRYNLGSPFTQLPLRNYTNGQPIKLPNLVSIPGLTVIPPLLFTASSDNPNVANARIGTSGTKLLVAPGNLTGIAHIVVSATDLDGARVSDTFTVNVVSAPGRLIQLSTRLQVGANDDVLIGGFIMSGSAPKRLMIRAVGPSTNLAGALANPFLELHDGTNALIASNDNWTSAPNKQDMIDTGITPASPNESAILTTLASSPSGAAYTAIVRGVNNTGGIGLVEVFDLDSGPGSTLLNISTRGPVKTDPNALIGGFFVGGTQSKNIVVRARGPSLSSVLPSALANPILELRNANGTLLDSNDDWQANNARSAQIQQSGLAPTNAKESAVFDILPPGLYTAIVRGVNGTAGIGIVEIYQVP